MRTAIAFFLITLYLISAVYGVYTVGEQRKPRTSAEAAFGVALSISLAAAVYFLWRSA